MLGCSLYATDKSLLLGLHDPTTDLQRCALAEVFLFVVRRRKAFPVTTQLLILKIIKEFVRM